MIRSFWKWERPVVCQKLPVSLRSVFPWAFPDILVGMRIGLGYSWRAIIGAEMIAAEKALISDPDAQQMSCPTR